MPPLTVSSRSRLADWKTPIPIFRGLRMSTATTTYVNGVRQEITSGGLRNIESDSSDEHLAEVAAEQMTELHSILRELGFDPES